MLSVVRQFEARAGIGWPPRRTIGRARPAGPRRRGLGPPIPRRRSSQAAAASRWPWCRRCARSPRQPGPAQGAATSARLLLLDRSSSSGRAPRVRSARRRPSTVRSGAHPPTLAYLMSAPEIRSAIGQAHRLALVDISVFGNVQRHPPVRERRERHHPVLGPGRHERRDHSVAGHDQAARGRVTELLAHPDIAAPADRTVAGAGRPAIPCAGYNPVRARTLIRAPIGSASAASRPNGVSIGSCRTAPPSSAARASVLSASATET